MAKKGSGKPIPKVELNLEPSPEEREQLLSTLKNRFEEHMGRHMEVEWPKVQARLEAQPEKLSSVYAMEDTGGEPDVVGYDEVADEYVLFDCSEQSPDGRRRHMGELHGGLLSAVRPIPRLHRYGAEARRLAGDYGSGRSLWT